MNHVHPDKWNIPQWHDDCGDAAYEVNMLRLFCVNLIDRFGNVGVELDPYEEGYIKVDIYCDTTKCAELYIVERESGNAYGLFTFEGKEEIDEFYFVDVEDGLEIFSELLLQHRRPPSD